MVPIRRFTPRCVYLRMIEFACLRGTMADDIAFSIVLSHLIMGPITALRNGKGRQFSFAAFTKILNLERAGELHNQGVKVTDPTAGPCAR